MEKITLRQLAEQAEENGQVIEVAEFGTLSNFLSYFDQHYMPILKELQAKWQGDKGNGAHRFFASDMMALFA